MRDSVLGEYVIAIVDSLWFYTYAFIPILRVFPLFDARDVLLILDIMPNSCFDALDRARMMAKW